MVVVQSCTDAGLNVAEGGWCTAHIDDNLFAAIIHKNLSHRGVGPTRKE